MRYALIADIHGNLPALRAVFSDLERRRVDEIVFLGDYFVSLPFPNEVIEAVRSSGACRVVRGNGEDYLTTLAKEDQNTWTDGQREPLYWYNRTITDDNKRWLASLPSDMLFYDGGTEIHIAHKSSAFIGNIEMPYVNRAALRRQFPDTFNQNLFNTYMQENLLSSKTFRRKLSSLSKGVYAFGHTHMQWQLFCDGVLLINPGSCGLPQDGETTAAYAVLDISADGFHAELCRIPYDVGGLIKSIEASALYGEARIWCELIMGELTTGRERVLPFLEYTENYANSIGDTVRPFSKETWRTAYEHWSIENK